MKNGMVRYMTMMIVATAPADVFYPWQEALDTDRERDATVMVWLAALNAAEQEA